MAVVPPRPKDLPLNALRAFEAAARLGGFSAAALELGVSPGAITAQVKVLEAALGVELFDRTARGVTLTAAGAQAGPALSDAFDRLRRAMQALQGVAPEQKVHIAALPALAQYWLTPRLPALRAALPQVSVSVTAMERPPNVKRHAFDLCLFIGAETRHQLCRDIIFPVCAPTLRTRLNRVGDLTAVSCLTDTAWAADWTAWAAVAMPGQTFTPRGPSFSLYALAVDEALNGAGVLMGHAVLIERHLARGDLVEPFSLRVELPKGLRLWPARPLGGQNPAAKVARWLAKST